MHCIPILGLIGAALAAATQTPTTLHPSVQQLHDTIETDTRLWLLFNTMVNQIPDDKQFLTPGEGLPQPMNYTAMSAAINRTISSGVAFSQVAEANRLTGQPLEGFAELPTLHGVSLRSVPGSAG